MRPARSLLLAMVAAAPLAAQSASHAHHPAATGDGVPLYDNLGTLHRRVTTRVPRAQQYFDQGLRLYYAFNHEASVTAFREAQRLDPACAMCAWGEAMALGPNINAPMDSAAGVAAHAAVKRAGAKAASGTALEQALVRAAALRYAAVPPARRAGLDSAYARAMRELALRHGDDADVLALAAEAQMDLSPWAYWEASGAPRPGTAELVRWLEAALAINPDHPGACHFYIHAVEAREPAKAVPCAERLARLMPGAGHLVHMPGHIYIRVGRWADAIDANRHAVHADETFLEGPTAVRGGVYEGGYYAHNWHFMAFAATMAGASALAQEASAQAAKVITPEMARTVPGAEPILPLPFYTAVTFGRWQEVLRLPLPPADLALASGMAHYARGIAFTALGRRAQARAALDTVRARGAALPAGDPRTVLEIAALVLEGELQLRNRDLAASVRSLQRAVQLEDGLTYMEPPTWYYPVRHSLGKALLAVGRAAEAEQAYREDLARFPENGWSLLGLYQALSAQRKSAEAAQVQRRFEVAWRNADVTIGSSRF